MYKIIRKKELTTAKWAGGTTTQLFIFPPEAEYTKFNFLFRISFATVEVEDSIFTFMPGVTRHLMILEGKLAIDHTNRYKKILKRFDSDTFSGEWPTTAKGKVKDFNLMTKEKTIGRIEHFSLKKNDTVTIDKKGTDYYGIYALTGSLEINVEDHQPKISAGDFMLVNPKSPDHLFITASKNAEIIVSAVKL